MVMISNYFTEKAPFKTMFFHGMLRDLHGRKFSKSLGNGIEPQYLIDRWGVDATRMALYTYSVPGRDARVSKQILDERGKNFRNFATKIRNMSRFIYELKSEGTKSESASSHKDDVQIKKVFEETASVVTSKLERFELHIAVDELYNFLWHEFADKYIEKSKTRRVEAQPALEYIFEGSLRLLHPFMPFLTEDLYQTYIGRKKSIMLENWPLF
jgi:valyl-tRNA synthetase